MTVPILIKHVTVPSDVLVSLCLRNYWHKEQKWSTQTKQFTVLQQKFLVFFLMYRSCQYIKAMS